MSPILHTHVFLGTPEGKATNHRSNPRSLSPHTPSKTAAHAQTLAYHYSPPATEHLSARIDDHPHRDGDSSGSSAWRPLTKGKAVAQACHRRARSYSVCATVPDELNAAGDGYEGAGLPAPLDLHKGERGPSHALASFSSQGRKGAVCQHRRSSTISSLSMPAAPPALSPRPQGSAVLLHQHLLMGPPIRRADGSTTKLRLVLDCTTGQTLALKALPAPALPRETRQLAHEAHVLTQLSGSPNVVRVLPGRCQEGLATDSLLLEHIPAGSLSDAMATFGGVLPETVVQQYIPGLLQGLVDVHSRGFVHCDIRAAHVLIDSTTGTPKLCSFKYARRDGNAPKGAMRKQRLQGSYRWMAPEVFRQEAQTWASDVWSLGCTIIELLTGLPPWEEVVETTQRSLTELIASTQAGPPIPGHVSDACTLFILRCLQPNAELRPTALELLRDPFVGTQAPCASTLKALSGSPAAASTTHALVASAPQVAPPPQNDKTGPNLSFKTHASGRAREAGKSLPKLADVDNLGIVTLEGRSGELTEEEEEEGPQFLMRSPVVRIDRMAGFKSASGGSQRHTAEPGERLARLAARVEGLSGWTTGGVEQRPGESSCAEGRVASGGAGGLAGSGGEQCQAGTLARADTHVSEATQCADEELLRLASLRRSPALRREWFDAEGLRICSISQAGSRAGSFLERASSLDSVDFELVTQASLRRSEVLKMQSSNVEPTELASAGKRNLGKSFSAASSELVLGLRDCSAVDAFRSINSAVAGEFSAADLLGESSIKLSTQLTSRSSIDCSSAAAVPGRSRFALFGVKGLALANQLDHQHSTASDSSFVVLSSDDEQGDDSAAEEEDAIGRVRDGDVSSRPEGVSSCRDFAILGPSMQQQAAMFGPQAQLPGDCVSLPSLTMPSAKHVQQTCEFGLNSLTATSAEKVLTTAPPHKEVMLAQENGEGEDHRGSSLGHLGGTWRDASESSRHTAALCCKRREPSTYSPREGGGSPKAIRSYPTSPLASFPSPSERSSLYSCQMTQTSHLFEEGVPKPHLSSFRPPPPKGAKPSAPSPRTRHSRSKSLHEQLHG